MLCAPLALNFLFSNEKNEIINVSSVFDAQEGNNTSNDEENIETLESQPTKNLPSEYTEVEYIMSTKNQFIDTGIFPTKTTEIIMKVDFKNEIAVVDSSVRNSFLGSSDTENKMVFSSNFGSTKAEGKNIHNWCDVTYANGEKDSRIIISEEAKRVPELYTKRSGFVSYGTVNTTTATTSYDRMKNSMFLFGLNSVTKGLLPFSRYDMYMYYCKIFDDGIKVRDFVPCVRIEDGVVGLYDHVSQDFFVSGTSENFVAGKKVEQETNYREYDDYFYDYNISYSTVKDTLSGDGTLTNPFVANSTEAFLYLVTCYNLNSKYIELGCNIVLNEENFDEEGIPNGGDGIVYEWRSIDAPVKCFNGNGFTIFGLWQKREDIAERSAGFFGRNHIQDEIKNLNFANVYVEENAQAYAYVVAYQIINMTNCNMLSGNFKTSKAQGAVICYIVTNIKDCNNYINAYSKTIEVSGMTTIIVGKMEGCNNFGNITSEEQSTTNGRVAGLALLTYSSSTKAKISNCNNYGDIYSTKQQAAGIVVWLNNAIIEDCKNYGSIYSGVRAAAGIVSMVHNVQCGSIVNCQNYGMVRSEYEYHQAGGIVGQCSSLTGYLLVRDCSDFSKSPIPLIGCVQQGKVIFDNCKKQLINKEKIVGSMPLFVGVLHSRDAEVEVQNVEVDIQCKSINILWMNYWSLPKSYSVKNVIVNITCDSMSSTTVNMRNELCTNDNIIFNFNVNGVKHRSFYGSDFSGFYCDWKNGKIGLKSLSSKGFYQATLTEQMLIEKGYQKRTA